MQFEQEMMPGQGGPMILGQWYNKRTGQKIYVRDSYMSDQGMQVMTSTGAMIDGEEFSRDYIQVSDEVFDESGKSTGKKEEVNYEDMFNSEEVAAAIKPATTTKGKKTPTEAPKTNPKADMLEKLFNKLNDVPTVSAQIIWANIPSAELTMLKNFFDVSDEDIADYIFNKYCSTEDIKTAISNQLAEILQS